MFLTADSDTSFWKRVQDEHIVEFNLSELDNAAEFVFRSWKSGSLLEINKKEDSINGFLTFYVYEVWEDNFTADKFVKTVKLSKSTSKALYEFIANSEFREVPSDKYIKGWQQGLDGITYIYELKEGRSYSFKNYWSPIFNNEIKEADYIIEFNRRIHQIVDFSSHLEEFTEALPFLSYRYPGTSYAIIKIVSRREWRKYKQERKKRNKGH